MRLSYNFALFITLNFLSPRFLVGTCGDQGQVIYPIGYVHPVDDDSVIPLPFITLRGKLIRHTFPGVPNYESSVLLGKYLIQRKKI